MRRMIGACLRILAADIVAEGWREGPKWFLLAGMYKSGSFARLEPDQRLLQATGRSEFRLIFDRARSESEALPGHPHGPDAARRQGA